MLPAIALWTILFANCIWVFASNMAVSKTNKKMRLADIFGKFTFL